MRIRRALTSSVDRDGRIGVCCLRWRRVPWPVRPRTRTAKNNAKEKVTICHRTGSDKHPYVEVSVGAKGALKGHAGHHAAKAVWGPKLKAAHERWGDIIPAFDIDGSHFDGLNLDTKGGANGDMSGQSILDAHCAVG